MINVVELFSGIGSQVKALKRAGLSFEVKAIAEWDVNSLVAYDLIHHGPQDLSRYNNMTKDDLVDELFDYGLSMNGKETMSYKSLKAFNHESLKRIKAAIERTKNLVNIENIKSSDLPNKIDLLTYSFPCQDLSNMGAIHGYTNGIDRNFKTRSGMLWQVERILIERKNSSFKMPKVLMLENVPSLNSSKHKTSFEDWKKQLETLGYENMTLTLNAVDFGIPQHRRRLILLSFLKDHLSLRKISKTDLESIKIEILQTVLDLPSLDNYLKLDYSKEIYLQEAISSTPNLTKSRLSIIAKNPELVTNSDTPKTRKFVPTITTKQDRNPNSGLIYFNKHPNANFSEYRYLTPRECFLLMGFDEEDYDKLLMFNFRHRKNSMFFTRDKLYKMSGNSIVVNVLQNIFDILQSNDLF